VLDNLLRNAVVHTPAGTPVHVKVRREGTLAVITVADEGPGLDPDQAGRLFDRFYRGSEARTGEGTGLGLSIVAALAAAHGGRAFVRSIPGQGTVFTVEVPAIDGSVLDQPALDRLTASDPGVLPVAVTSPPTGPETAGEVEIPALDEADHGPRPVRH
jgi:K+-sensing histidine kinase KdpD